MPSFNEVRKEPCPRDGARVVYQYGNWHCGGYHRGEGCGWTTRTERRENDGNDGSFTLEHCPACGDRIVYNGNYFCEHWESGCNWALPDRPKQKADRAMALRLFGERG